MNQRRKINNFVLPFSFTVLATFGWLILAIGLSGCVKRMGETRIPLLPSLTVPLATQIALPSETPTTHLTVTRFKLVIHNQFDWEAFVFLDHVFLLKIHPQRSGVYMDLSAGEHVLQFCRDEKAINCEAPFSFSADGDLILISDRGILPPPEETSYEPLETPGAVIQPSISAPTDAIQPTIIFQTQMPTPVASSMPIADWTPMPTLPIEKMSFMLTIHNRYIWPMRVEVDDQYLMTVPPRRYLWHLNIPGGAHILKFCWDGGWCIDREIYLDHDLEIIVSP